MKSFQDLNLTDDFLFTHVMSDPKVLKPVLEILLDMPIQHVELVTPQRAFDISPESHGIRLDVFADDDKHSRFAVEMQNYHDYNIGKRSRYYHDVIDLDALQQGSHYSELKDSYVIFICTEDYFNRGLHRYCFRSVCLDDKELILDDKRLTLILNTRGTADDVNPDVHAFLKFCEESTQEMADNLSNPVIDIIMQKIKDIKTARQMEVTYVTLQEHYEREREAGIQKGIVINLIRQIQKKLARSLSSAAIADAVEESVEYVDTIISVIKANPDSSDNDIYDILHPESK